MKPEDLKLIFEKVIEHAKEDGAQIFFPEIVDSPEGQEQDDDDEFFKTIYVDQRSNFEDSYYGNIYYPLGDKWLKVGFCI